MQSNIIKLPDIDGNMRFYNFCPTCHYLIWGDNYGVNYCPHCGTQLFWELDKAKEHHQIDFDYSIEYYERLKNGK